MDSFNTNTLNYSNASSVSGNEWVSAPSENGDIIIVPESPQKNPKKIIVIILSILVLAIIVAIVVVLMINNSSSGRISEQEAVEDVFVLSEQDRYGRIRSSFESLTNLIIGDKTSTDTSNWPLIQNVSNSTADKSKYADNLMSAANDLIEKLKEYTLKNTYNNDSPVIREGYMLAGIASAFSNYFRIDQGLEDIKAGASLSVQGVDESISSTSIGGLVQDLLGRIMRYYAVATAESSSDEEIGQVKSDTDESFRKLVVVLPSIIDSLKDGLGEVNE